jgi:hypothetical protein
VLCCPQWHESLRGNAREGNILLQVWTERLVAIKGALTLLFGQLGQRRAGHGISWRDCHAQDYAK